MHLGNQIFHWNLSFLYLRKINEDLIQLIDKLKQYRIYIASMKSNINEELITEIIVKSEEEKIEEIAEAAWGRKD